MEVVDRGQTELTLKWDGRLELRPAGDWHPTRVMPRGGHGDFVAFDGLEAATRIVDLRPATWYELRHDGQTHTVATLCAPPDTPGRPRVTEEATHTHKARLVGAARHLAAFLDDPPQPQWRLKVAWPPSAPNGYPIRHYRVQQRACVASGGRLAWTAWRETHVGHRTSCIVRPNTSFALDFRVAAVNALGSSPFGPRLRVTSARCPNVVATPSEALPDDAEATDDVEASAKDNDADLLRDLAAALDFPVSPDVLRRALRETRESLDVPSVSCSREDSFVLPKTKSKRPTKKTRRRLGEIDTSRLLTPAQRRLVTAMAELRRHDALFPPQREVA